MILYYTFDFIIRFFLMFSSKLPKEVIGGNAQMFVLSSRGEKEILTKNAAFKALHCNTYRVSQTRHRMLLEPHCNGSITSSRHPLSLEINFLGVSYQD